MKKGFPKAFHHGLESDFRVYSTFDIDDVGDGCRFCYYHWYSGPSHHGWIYAVPAFDGEGPP